MVFVGFQIAKYNTCESQKLGTNVPCILPIHYCSLPLDEMNILHVVLQTSNTPLPIFS